MDLPETWTIEDRYCGPPDSGNGGYVCGKLASFVAGEAEARLRKPPPLARPLEIREAAGGSGVELWDGSELVASAAPGTLETTGFRIPDAVSLTEAVEAAKAFSGYALHWFPSCFVCGPERRAGDGLRIFPGLLPGSEVVAGPWQVDASLSDASGLVRDEFVWAALDCAGAFAFPPDPERTLVLGSLTARVEARPAAGERCAVLGWPAGIDGRKYFAGTAIFRASGERVGVARATWIRIPQPSASRGSSNPPA